MGVMASWRVDRVHFTAPYFLTPSVLLSLERNESWEGG